MPTPVFARLVTPVPLLVRAAESVLAPVLVPARVSVRAMSGVAMVAAPERVSAPVPEASKVPPPESIVKLRSVSWAAPV